MPGLKPHEVGRHILDTRQIPPEQPSEAALQRLEREKVAKEARERVIEVGAKAIEDFSASPNSRAPMGHERAAALTETVLRAVGVLD